MSEAGSGKTRLVTLCEARDCPKPPLTAFTDGAGESWWLCEEHGDLLAVGFPTRRPRSTPLPYEAVARLVEDDNVLYPPADLVMVVTSDNTAHVLLPRGERPVFHPTVCGSRMDDLAAIPQDVQDTLAAPWSLLTDRQYRAWPPWPCQTCTGITQRAAAEVSTARDGDGFGSSTGGSDGS